jgi:hypothetical protein
MNFFGRALETEDLTSIAMEWKTLRLEILPVAVAIYAPVHVYDQKNSTIIDPSSYAGDLGVLWSHISARPLRMWEDKNSFNIEFADGLRLEVPYQEGYENINIWGPDDNMFTALPS